MNNNVIIIVLVVLVSLSAFFSATETAFSSLNKIYSFLDNFSVNYAIASKNMKYNKYTT